MEPKADHEVKHRQPLNQDRLDLFISELEVHSVAVEAARVASPGSTHPRGAIATFRGERARNPSFAKRWDAAVNRATSALEREVLRRMRYR